MATSGMTLESPRIGQRITFVSTAAETEGGELSIDARMAPGAFIPWHIHLHQTETFEVRSGEATFWVRRRRIVAPAGETVVIPPRTAHRFRNRSREEVCVRATMRPALRVEELFERLFRLGAEGKVNRIGAPPPLTTAALVREFRDEFFYLPWLPVTLQRLLAGARP